MEETFRGRKEMRPFGDLTPYAEALQAALDLCETIAESRSVPLGEARGRQVFADIVAPTDVPAADRAAMDGFAVRGEDLAGDTLRLRSRGRSLAGELEETELGAGESREVATGARMPRGADTVVPVEKTRADGDHVVIVEAVAPGAHVSPRGEDLGQGDVVVAAGAFITPAAAAALASIGVTAVEVRRRPRVLLVPTGDELVPIGEPLQPGQVYDSNSVGVRMLLESNGAVIERTPILRDDPRALVDGIQGHAFDLIVTLGGTSVGRHDLVLDVVDELGDVLVHGVAIKPGKPVLVAKVGDTPLLGLPGFPTSCLFTGHTFAEPMVRKLGGLPGGHRRTARAVLGEAVRSPGEKLQFLTVRLEDNTAFPVYRASSTITSMSRAEGWIEVPAGTDAVAAGSPVDVTFF